MLSASFKHIAANTAAFSTAFAGAYRANEGAAGHLGDGVARYVNAAERSFSKIEGDLCGIFARFGWSFGVCLAGVGLFGSNMVRMMLSGFPRGAVCRTADAYSSSIYALVPGFRCRKTAALAVA